MATHTKPTAEELNAQLNASIEAAEKPEVDEETPTPDPKVEADKSIETPEVKDTNDETEADKEKGDKAVASQVDPQIEADKEKEALRKRVANSSRENEIIMAQNKKMAEAFDKASEVPEPTEDDLAKTYPDWEGMSDFEKKMAKNALINDLRFAAIKEASKDFKDLEQWTGKVDAFVDSPENLTKYPLLEGKQEDFKLYATHPRRRGVDFEDLVAGFLFTAEVNKPKNKGKMFPVGSAGDKKHSNPAPQKLSISDSEKLRNSNYSEYVKQLRAGNISNEVPV